MAIENKIGIARNIAYKVLCDVYIGGAYSNLSIQKHFLVLKKPEDKALATAVIFGTLKRNIQLRRVIEKLSSVPYEQIKSEIAVLLKSALYQLFYLDRLPPYAVVNDSVNIAKFYISKKSGSFVNAVLRSALRAGKQTLLQRENNGDFCEDLEQSYNIPVWLCRYLKKAFSEEFLYAWAQDYQSSPKMYVRVNTLKISPKNALKEMNTEQIVCKETVLPDVFKVLVPYAVLQSELFLNACLSVQDLSSAFCAYALDVQAGEEVLDLCAAPGGKSLHIASLTGDGADITACDIYKNKVELMRKQFAVHGVKNICACKNDAAIYNPAFESKFDRVLADVPCSGLGVIKRKPEILLSLDETKIEELIRIQKNILRNAAKYVKRGGTLVYSTCSINPSENEHVIAEFLSEFGEFSPSGIVLPDNLTGAPQHVAAGELKIYPQDAQGDGFYICKMKKK